MVDQAALTGESMPVAVYAGGGVFAGSVVTQGEAEGIVCAIGPNTFMAGSSGCVSPRHIMPLYSRNESLISCR